MSQERNVSPLPVGRYWLDLSGDTAIDDFNQWRSEMGNAVKVETTEEKPGSLFVIFRVTSNAAFFPAERFGFPNKAPSRIKNREDVEQAPVIDEPDLGTVLEGMKTAGKLAAFALAGLLVYKVVKK